jgi:hypothetical protein
MAGSEANRLSRAVPRAAPSFHFIVSNDRGFELPQAVDRSNNALSTHFPGISIPFAACCGPKLSPVPLRFQVQDTTRHHACPPFLVLLTSAPWCPPHLLLPTWSGIDDSRHNLACAYKLAYVTSNARASQGFDSSFCSE